jgi:transcriptional regulator with PAS, ATPase and Fis domain
MKIVDNRKIFDTRKIQNLLDIVDPKKDTIDLGICRADLVAIAGTGTYRCNVGKHRPDTLLSQVVKTGRPLILENRNSSDQCRRCPGKSACPYKGVVYYPLKIDDVTLGAIYLMSKKVLSNNAQLYAEFLQKLSSFTMELIASDKSFFQNERYVNSIIDLIPDGLVTCSQKGLVKNINTSALKFFNLRSHDASGAIDIRSLLPNIRLDTEDSTYRYNDRFKIKVRHIEDTGYILRISPDLILDLKKLDYIVGSSDAIKAAKERACVIAKYDSPTLILGETGSGKELFAQAIHNQSSRGTKDLVTIDCSSIPGNLLESELFGYVEGAFTGAKASGKKGKLELSNNGSIFLDEIGEIPLHLQSKLLRVIENNTFDRLGDTKTTYVNTRIIAATNRDLWQMVQEGKFRNDLYYRLNVMQLQVPPLRARKGDIRALTDYFLDFYNRTVLSQR